MTTQPPGTPGTPGSVLDPGAYDSFRPDADWNSPLWGQPETVAAGSSRGQDLPPAPPTWPVAPAQPPRRVSRALLAAVAAAVLLVGTGGGVLVDHSLRHDSGAAAAAQPRVGNRVPTLPTPAPSAPSLTPPNIGSGQPNPGSSAPGSSGTGSSGSGSLTPQQQAAAAAVTPGLVDIVSTIGYDGAAGAGTGVVLSSDGIVLTNHHVVAGSTSIRVTDIGDGHTYSAKVLGYDRSHDVAVIKLSGASGLQTARLGNSSTVSVGDAVVAVGNALGKGGTPTAVAGTVTALNQSIAAQDSATGTSQQLSGLIQVDAPIQPGDSGGALADANGKVVGIVTAGSQSNSPDQTATQGFAIPIADAHRIGAQIVDGKSSSTVHIGGTAFLGLQVSGTASGTPVDGVLVAGTVDGSAAAAAGIVGGDVVTAVNGHQVADGEALKSALAGKLPGDTVSLRWTDQTGASHTAKVTLTDGPTG